MAQFAIPIAQPSSEQIPEPSRHVANQEHHLRHMDDLRRLSLRRLSGSAFSLFTFLKNEPRFALNPFKHCCPRVKLLK